MRVVNRDTFLLLPPGTIYCKGKQWCFEGLSVKHETTDLGDWWSFDPAWIEGNTSDECLDRLDEMLEQGGEYPMAESVTRDGLHERDAVFLVFGKADLTALRGYIDAALAVS